MFDTWLRPGDSTDAWWWMAAAGVAGLAFLVAGAVRTLLHGGPRKAEWQALPRALRCLSVPAAVLAAALPADVQPGRRMLEPLLQRAALHAVLDPRQFVALQVCAASLLLLASTPFVLTGGLSPGLAGLAAMAAALWPLSWLRDRGERRRQAIERELAFLLDLLVVAVEAGLGLSSALDRAGADMPVGPLREELDRVMRDLRAGRTRDEALLALGERIGSTALSQFVAAVLNAARQGANLGPILRAQAEQRRAERFARAEKRAMEAPVRLLGPLIVCIFPGTFLILMFPVAMRLLDQGFLR